MSFCGCKGTNKRAKYKRKSQVFLFIFERKYFRRMSNLRQKNETAKKGVGNCKTTRVKFANYTCVVGHFNVLSCDS